MNWKNKSPYDLLGWVFSACLVITAALHGAILAFKASIILGIVCLILQLPLPVFGFAMWFFKVDLARMFVNWVSGLF